MNAQVPLRITPDHQADELDRRAEAALARFRAQWPPERCKALGDAIIGTPEEREAAEARIVERALAPREDDSPADAAVRKLVEGQRAFIRSNLK